MKSIKYIICCCAVLVLLATSVHAQQKVVTSKGKFPLDANGAPEKETIQALFDEMDYQRAVQTYLWAMPQMVVAGQHRSHQFYGAKGNLDFFHQYKDPSVPGMRLCFLVLPQVQFNVYDGFQRNQYNQQPQG